MAGRTTATVLYEPHSGEYRVTGHAGKVIPFRHPNGIYPKNIAQMYAQMYAAGGLSGYNGHTAICARCGRQTTVENIAKHLAYGWEWSDGSGWICNVCACGAERGARPWR